MKKKGRILKKMFPKGFKETGLTVAVIILIGASLMGVLGIIIALNLLVTTPFILGMVGVGQFGDDVRETTQGVVGRTKDMWRENSGQKKVALVGGVGLLLPFIAIGLMWMLTMAVGFAIDIIMFVPFVFLIMWVYFRMPSARNTTLGGILGHPIIGIIGIIGVIIILMSATITWQESNQYNGTIENMEETTTPLWQTDGDVEITSLWDAVNGTWANTTTSKVVPTVIFKVVDPFFNDVGFVSNVDSDSVGATDNTTENVNEYSLILEDTDGFSPVPNALVTLTCFDKESKTNLLPVGKKTNANGQITYSNVPYGIYDMSVDCGGYLKYNEEIHLDEDFSNGTIVINMRPVYYKIRMHYEFTPDGAVREKSGWFKNTYKYGAGNVTAWAEVIGGLEKSDWDNIRRQQSMYSWSGIPSAGLMNSIMPIQQSMMGFRNQITLTTQSIWLLLWLSPAGLIVDEVLSQDDFDFEEKQQTLREEERFSRHSVRLVSDNSFATESGEAGVTYQNVYSRQIPTPNVLSVHASKDILNATTQELYDAWLDWYDAHGVDPLDGNWFTDTQALGGAGDLSTYYEFRETYRLDTSSISMIRDYDYLVWTQAKEDSTITLQFNVTTTFTVYNRVSDWGSLQSETETTYTVYDDYVLQFNNKLPTAQNYAVGG